MAANELIGVQLLFTVGMTLVDSLDSVLMLYAYASPSRTTAEGKIGLFRSQKPETSQAGNSESEPLLSDEESVSAYLAARTTEGSEGTDVPDEMINNKLNVMSSLSITLTALSIIVALWLVAVYQRLMRIRR